MKNYLYNKKSIVYKTATTKKTIQNFLTGPYGLECPRSDKIVTNTVSKTARSDQNSECKKYKKTRKTKTPDK